MKHVERKHAKYSASSMDRLEACPGSAALSEGQPDKSSPWALEGTKAHEVLETIMRSKIEPREFVQYYIEDDWTNEMVAHAESASTFMVDVWKGRPGSEIMVETKVDLSFIHEDCGGTFDGAVVDLFGTLHVFDYKYGAGHAVSPVENLQMATYSVGLAHKHHWNFKRVRHWIIQPRIKGYDGAVYWEIPTVELKYVYARRIQRIIDRAIEEPTTYNDGPHCHWCKAKGICPLKTESRNEKAKTIFTGGNRNGSEEGTQEKETVRSEAEWRKTVGKEKAKGKTKEAGTARGVASGSDTDFF